MNQLQEFMSRTFGQAQPHVQEAATVNGQIVYGTFGDPQILPVMTRQGTQDHLVTVLQVARTWFAGQPKSKTKVLRPATSREYFVQVIDYTHPVVFTFVLTDREL